MRSSKFKKAILTGTLIASLLFGALPKPAYAGFSDVAEPETKTTVQTVQSNNISKSSNSSQKPIVDVKKTPPQPLPMPSTKVSNNVQQPKLETMVSKSNTSKSSNIIIPIVPSSTSNKTQVTKNSNYNNNNNTLMSNQVSRISNQKPMSNQSMNTQGNGQAMLDAKIKELVYGNLSKKDYTTAITSLTMLEKDYKNSQSLKDARELVEQIAVFDLSADAERCRQLCDFKKFNELYDKAVANGRDLGVENFVTEQMYSFAKLVKQKMDEQKSQTNTVKTEEDMFANMNDFQRIMTSGLTLTKQVDVSIREKKNGYAFLKQKVEGYKEKMSQSQLSDKDKQLAWADQYITQVNKELAECDQDTTGILEYIVSQFDKVQSQVVAIQQNGVAKDRNEFVVYETLKSKSMELREQAVKFEDLYGFEGKNSDQVMEIISTLDKDAVLMQNSLDAAAKRVQIDYNCIITSFNDIKKSVADNKSSYADSVKSIDELIANARDGDKNYGSNLFDYKSAIIDMQMYEIENNRNLPAVQPIVVKKSETNVTPATNIVQLPQTNKTPVVYKTNAPIITIPTILSNTNKIVVLPVVEKPKPEVKKQEYSGPSGTYLEMRMDKIQKDQSTLNKNYEKMGKDLYHHLNSPIENPKPLYQISGIGLLSILGGIIGSGIMYAATRRRDPIVRQQAHACSGAGDC